MNANRREKTFIILSAYLFLTEMAERLLFVFFPMFLIEKGIRPLEMGAVFSFASLVLVISRIFLGKLSDIIGRKPIMSMGIMLNMVAITAYGFCSSAFQFLVAKSVREVGKNMVSGVYDAIQADEFPRGVRKRYLRKIGTVLPASRALGVLLGFIIASLSSYIIGFYCAAVLVFAGGLVFLLFYRPVYRGKMSKSTRKSVLKFSFGKYSRRFLLACFVGFTGSFGFTLAYYPAFFMKARSVGLSTAHLFLLFFLAYVLAALLIHTLREKIERAKEETITVGGILAMGVGILGYSTSSAAFFVLSLVAVVLSYYVWRIGFKTYLYNSTTGKMRGEQLGFAKMLDGVGTILGPITGGAVIERMSLNAAFSLAFTVYLIAFLVMLALGGVTRCVKKAGSEQENKERYLII